MRKNSLKETWKSGGVVLNGWLHIPNTWTAELMAHAGWDSLTIDTQHGLPSVETAVKMMQSISTSDTVPLARVSWNDPASIMRLLDGGAYGIICPMINNQSDCESFVKACRYPPLGFRSFGPIRARLYAGDDYGEFANREILTIAMVETVEAMDNLEDICGVAGLDAIFVGSSDLTLSLQADLGTKDVSRFFEKAIDRILGCCIKYNVVPGIWVPSIEKAKHMIKKGFKFISPMSDSLMLQQAAKKSVQDLKSF